jgi:hypothetical protein
MLHSAKNLKLSVLKLKVLTQKVSFTDKSTCILGTPKYPVNLLHIILLNTSTFFTKL